MPDKKVITLQQLEDLWAEHLYRTTGLLQPKGFPIEKAPAFFTACKRSWSFFGEQKRKRDQQLAILDMIDTHEIDYYVKQKPITPL